MDGPESNDETPLMDLRRLKALSVLGRGAKGMAFLVRNQESPSLSEEPLALKVISKALIDKKKKKKNNEKESSSGSNNEDGLKRIWFERDVLKLLNHPLLPKLRGVVVTDEIVSFAIDYCPGGNLASLRKQQTENMFSEDLIRFYAAEIVLALEYLHGLGIIYRDLKPENILIQENGHLMLVDFDLSTKVSSTDHDQINPTPSPSSRTAKSSSDEKKKKRFPSFRPRRSGISPVDSVVSSTETGFDSRRKPHESTSDEKSNSFVGTEEYVAPEIIIGNGHGFAVDQWGLGVVMYEMLYGRTPFRGTNRSETFYRILAKEPELLGDPTALRDLIRKLLGKDPAKRISIEAIKGHEFFRGLDWYSVMRISRPPFIPPPRWDEGEDLEGIKGIDVESYVKAVSDSLNADATTDKDVWRQGLGNPIKTSEFSVF